MRNLTIFFLFALALSFVTVQSHAEHKCIHDELESDYDFIDVEEHNPQAEGRLLAGTTYENIRIYPYFDTLAGAPTEFIDYVQNELVPPVIAYFEAALKNKFPLTSNIKLATSVKTLCSTPTPSILTTTGVDTDFFIMFASEDNEESNYAASAAYCFLSSGSKRPIIARTLFNRKYIQLPNGDAVQHEMNMVTLMHELTHAFGFTKSAYQYYVDENGVTRTGHITTKQVYGTTPSTILNVPSLTAKLRTFFGCSTLEGLYLENNGADATAGSHLERRQFVYEIMSSGSIPGKRMSEFTLAVLEASGWYVANYTYAEPYFFGQGQGCPFLKDNCSSSAFTFEEFCKGTGRGCAPHGRGGGSCISDSNTDGCNYYYPYANYDCENELSSDYARYPEIQSFGRDTGSKCFEGTLTKLKSSTATNFCFKYTCSGSGLTTAVNVQVGTSTIKCTKQGPMAVTGYNGAVDCPDPLTFCSTIGKQYCPRNCMGRGECVSNKCVCKKGFTGVDCALLV